MHIVFIGIVCLVVGLIGGMALQYSQGAELDESAQAVLAFRAMGCAPYYTRTGALNAGCQKVIKLEAQQ